MSRHLIPRAVVFTAMLVVTSTLLFPKNARADEYDEFAIAKNAFDAGEYQEAVKRFEALLAKGIQNPSLIIESHKFVAISYLFIGNEAAAESHFNKLLTRAPDFTLDPLLYPIEVIDFFTKIKQKNKKQLDALAKARAIEEADRKAREAERQKAEAERLRRNIYIERTVEKSSLLVALLPFGAGQFQNKHVVKGYLFLSSEVLLGAGAVTFYFLHASLRDDARAPIADTNRRRTLALREKVYRIANHVSLSAFALVAAAGITDAIIGFQREKTQWRNVNEADVPDDMRYKPKPRSVVLTVQPNLFGMTLSGEF